MESIVEAESVYELPPLQKRTVDCPSCGARADGRFCAACGEETHVVAPSATEFLHEFIGHYVALEGRLLKTLRVLMFEPGRLTLHYLAGRRIAFISPLRLYLTLSVIVFALIKIDGVELPQLTIDGNSFGATYSHTTAEKTATLAIKVKDTGPPAGPLAPAARGAMLGGAIEALGSVNRNWMKNLKSEALNYGFLAYLPYMLVGALPLFALYLKLIYAGAGRHYGEHLVFALHANAFAFLLASLMIVVPGNVAWLALCLHERLFSLLSGWDYLQLMPFFWLVLYLPAAMQRVYPGAYWATACRWLVLLSAHLATISVMTIAAELVGIVTH